MSRCVSPLAAWWSAAVNDGGHRYAAFSLRAGRADEPLTLPCGRCIGCIQDRCQEWSVRCYHESVCHEQNSFCTLTYADPAPDALCKADLQLFFKRLRAAGFGFRYFAAGEYGSRTRRPHYHVLFFGQDWRDGSYSMGMGVKAEAGYYCNDLVRDAWGLGHVTIAACEPGSIFYTAGYTLKSLDDPDAFHLVSRRPPLGQEWLDRYSDDAIRNGFVTIDGRKYPVPSAYLKRKGHVHDFATLVDRRRLHARSRPASEAGKQALSGRSREINIRSGASNARGSL